MRVNKCIHFLNRIVLSFLLIVFISFLSHANIYLSMYAFDGGLLNPAQESVFFDQQVSLITSHQWVSISNAPYTTYFHFGKKVTPALRLGMKYYNDFELPTRSNHWSMQGNYMLDLSESELAPRFISWGVELGYGYTQYSVRDLFTYDDEPLLGYEGSANVFDFSLGGYYYSEQLDVGISITPRKRRSLENSSIQISSLPSYLLKVGTKVVIPQYSLIFFPDALLSYEESLEFDISTNVEWAERLLTGLRYRVGENIGLVIQKTFLSKNQFASKGKVYAFKVGYSVENHFNKYNSSILFHELGISYIVEKKAPKAFCYCR